MRTLSRKRLAGYRRVLRSYNKLGYANAEVLLARGRSAGARSMQITSFVRATRPEQIRSGRQFYIGTVTPSKMRVIWRLLTVRVEELGHAVGTAATTTAAAGTALQQLDTARLATEHKTIETGAFPATAAQTDAQAQIYMRTFGKQFEDDPITNPEPLMRNMTVREWELAGHTDGPLVLTVQRAASPAEEELGVVTEPIHNEVPDQYQADVDMAIGLAWEIINKTSTVRGGWAPRLRQRVGIPATTRLKRDVLLAFWRWLQALSIEETGKMLEIPLVVLEAREK